MKTLYNIPFILLLIATMACNKNPNTSNSTTDNEQKTQQKATSDKNRITDKYWKLIELLGKEVITSEDQDRELHFVLHTHNKIIAGHSGCNSFNGYFEIGKNNRIKIDQLASTRMACPDLADESTFLQLLDKTDSYSISNDTLSLKAGIAKLAKFEAVYLY